MGTYNEHKKRSELQTKRHGRIDSIMVRIGPDGVHHVLHLSRHPTSEADGACDVTSDTPTSTDFHAGRSRTWLVRAVAGYVAWHWRTAVTGNAGPWRVRDEVDIGTLRYRLRLVRSVAGGKEGEINHSTRTIGIRTGTPLEVLHRAAFAVDLAWREWRKVTLRLALSPPLPESLPAAEVEALRPDFEAAAAKLFGDDWRTEA